MGNACGAGSSGAVREQRAKWLRDDTEAMDCHIPHFCDNMHKRVR